MKIELNSMIKKLSQLQGQRNLLIEQQKEAQKNSLNFQKTYNNILKARAIVQIVAENTQKQIEYHISNLVTMALASVFPDPYEFKLQFVQRRNKTEADLIFLKNENEITDILESGGGGVADIASLALRIALWSIKKTNPTIMLDEPCKFLHNPIYQEKASELLKEVSDRLGIQMIMVSDQQSLLKSADKVIEIVNVNGISIVKDDNSSQNVSRKLLRRRSEKNSRKI